MEKIHTDNWNVNILIREPRTEEEAVYQALVRLCDERSEWHPATSGEQCAWASIQCPEDNHPVLEDPKYHCYGDNAEPLNLRGRRKLAWMQYKYEQAANGYWEIVNG